MFGGRIEVPLVLDDRDVADVGVAARGSRARGARQRVASGLCSRTRGASRAHRAPASAGCRRGRCVLQRLRLGLLVGSSELGLVLRRARWRRDWSWSSGAECRRRRTAGSAARGRQQPQDNGREEGASRAGYLLDLIEDLLRVGGFLGVRRGRDELLEVGLRLRAVSRPRRRRGRGSSTACSASGTARSAWSADRPLPALACR